jgi:hypothetical protein
MNIFYLHKKQSKCARWHCDKHVVKMILETTQLLYTAHWMLCIEAGKLPNFATAPSMKGEPRMRGYLPISNAKHPCALWTRASVEHYRWLVILGMALCNEFRVRFTGKAHSCETHLRWLYFNEPAGFQATSWTEPPLAMAEEFRCSKSAIVSYRNYYKKGKSHLLSYTLRHKPSWLKEVQTPLSISGMV